MKDVEGRPLDDLLSLRGKPFSDWKEERKYLRDKWGMQGRQITQEEMQAEKESRKQDKQKEEKS
jgi:hypothetical protein